MRTKLTLFITLTIFSLMFSQVIAIPNLASRYNKFRSGFGKKALLANRIITPNNDAFISKILLNNKAALATRRNDNDIIVVDSDDAWNIDNGYYTTEDEPCDTTSESEGIQPSNIVIEPQTARTSQFLGPPTNETLRVNNYDQWNIEHNYDTPTDEPCDETSVNDS